LGFVTDLRYHGGVQQHVQVKVVNQRGDPLKNERVSIFIAKIASGGVPDQSTDDKGFAVFELEVGESPEIIVYVRGRERFPRGPLKQSYLVAV